jgi:ATP-dependent DNA helicase PIF1
MKRVAEEQEDAKEPGSKRQRGEPELPSRELPSSERACSAEQEEILEAVFKGSRNVRFGGVAGTGKSFTLKRIKEWLQQTLREEEYAFAAPTGTAAVNIEGVTLHSVMGCAVPKIMDGFLSAAGKKKRDLTQLKILVVDEVSMCAASFLDAVDLELKVARRSGESFGGVKVVFCCDFAQLGPIEDKVRQDELGMEMWLGEDYPDKNACFKSRGYAFQARCWAKADFQVMELTKVFRQEDAQFATILGQLRLGVVTAEAEYLLSTDLAVALEQREGGLPEGHEPVSLFALNAKADALNARRLAELPANSEQVYEADDTIVTFNRGMQRKFLETHYFFRENRCAKTVTLRRGAQVMLVLNLDVKGGVRAKESLCNGSCGVVTGFRPERVGGLKAYPVVKFTNGVERLMVPENTQHEERGKMKLSRRQVPLRLAWAMSIHKAQGATLEYARVDLADVFAPGQAYVALSRVRSLKGLEVHGFTRACIMTHPLVRQFYEQEGRLDGIPTWFEQFAQELEEARKPKTK